MWDSSCSYVEYYTGIDPAILFPAIFMTATFIIIIIITFIITVNYPVKSLGQPAIV